MCAISLCDYSICKAKKIVERHKGKAGKLALTKPADCVSAGGFSFDNSIFGTASPWTFLCE